MEFILYINDSNINNNNNMKIKIKDDTTSTKITTFYNEYNGWGNLLLNNPSSLEYIYIYAYNSAENEIKGCVRINITDKKIDYAYVPIRFNN